MLTTDQVLPRQPTVSLRSDASYLVVGGFGGIGRSVCRWLAEHGAKHVVVASRSAGGSERVHQLRKELKDVATDISVTAISCDISDMAQLQKALDEYTASGAPAIRGLVHGGMELQDSILEQMSLPSHRAALAPKLHGSLNLHRYFSSASSLDFFIMLSSLIGTVGFASQSNYSAGGAFQDALARHRATLGLPGVSLDLGIVKSVGYLAEDNAAAAKSVETLVRHGFMALSEDDVLAAIGSGITSPFSGDLALGVNTGPAGHGEDSALARDRRFSALQYRATSQDGSAAKSSATGDLGGSIAEAATFEDAVAVVLAGIAKKLMDIFMMAEDEVVASKSPAEFGVDSLVAVELRNMLAMKAGAELSIFDIMQSTSLTALAGVVAGRSRFLEGGLVPS